MSEKLINNPLDESVTEPQTQKAEKKPRSFKFNGSFLGKDNILSPCLLIITMLLLVLFRVSIKILPDKVGGYLGVVVLLTIIFFIPTYLFYKFTKRGKMGSVIREIKLLPPKISHIFLLLSGSIFCCAILFLINLIFRLKSGYTDGFYLYNTFFTGKLPVPDTPLFPIIAFALIPAICEEFMFRGIFQATYEKQGFMSAALTTSIMYALISLDIRTFLSSLALGLFLSFILYLTKSLVSCFIVNFLYKCFMLFFGTNLQSYILSSSNKAVFFAVVIGLLLLSLALFCFECARLFKLNAKGKYPLPRMTVQNKSKTLQKVLENISAISILICVVIFVIAIFIK